MCFEDCVTALGAGKQVEASIHFTATCMLVQDKCKDLQARLSRAEEQLSSPLLGRTASRRMETAAAADGGEGLSGPGADGAAGGSPSAGALEEELSRAKEDLVAARNSAEQVGSPTRCPAERLPADHRFLQSWEDVLSQAVPVGTVPRRVGCMLLRALFPAAQRLGPCLYVARAQYKAISKANEEALRSLGEAHKELQESAQRAQALAQEEAAGLEKRVQALQAEMDEKGAAAAAAAKQAEEALQSLTVERDQLRAQVEQMRSVGEGLGVRGFTDEVTDGPWVPGSRSYKCRSAPCRRSTGTGP